VVYTRVIASLVHRVVYTWVIVFLVPWWVLYTRVIASLVPWWVVYTLGIVHPGTMVGSVHPGIYASLYTLGIPPYTRCTLRSTGSSGLGVTSPRDGALGSNLGLIWDMRRREALCLPKV